MVNHPPQQPHQPYPPQGQHPHQPYPPQGPYAHQPYGHHPAPPPHPYPPQPSPAVPRAVGDNRRSLAAALDGLITFVAGFSLGIRVPDDQGTGMFWAGFAGCLLGVSFAHHVLGTWIFRTTLAKLLLGTRVVRDADGGRPRFWQTVKRWLLGLTSLPMQPLLSIVGGEGEPYDDRCGLRWVRRGDLR